MEEDLLILLDSNLLDKGEDCYELEHLQLTAGTKISATATVGLKIKGI